MAQYGRAAQCSNGEPHSQPAIKCSVVYRINLPCYVLQNQTVNLDKSIDDVLEHFVYQPKQATANAQDIPFFLSTRLADTEEKVSEDIFGNKDPVQLVARYENRAAELANEYEENMVRF